MNQFEEKGELKAEKLVDHVNAFQKIFLSGLNPRFTPLKIGI